MSRWFLHHALAFLGCWICAAGAVALPVERSQLASEPSGPGLVGDIEETIPPPSKALQDTIWIADWTFDVFGGGCTDAGWVKYDNHILNDGSNYWSVNNGFDSIGGIVNNAAVLARHDLLWVRDGYGNNWDYSIILLYRGASSLQFSYLSDSEPGFDFVSVEADSAGASEARVDFGVDPLATPAGFRTVLFSVDGPQNGSAGPLGVPPHRSELQDVEGPPSPAHPALPVEDVDAVGLRVPEDQSGSDPGGPRGRGGRSGERGDRAFAPGPGGRSHGRGPSPRRGRLPTGRRRTRTA